MSVRFIMKIKHVALRVQLRRIGAIVLDRVDMWKCFHAEFAIKSSAEGVEDLILLLGAMPDVPLMHIANRGI